MEVSKVNRIVIFFRVLKEEDVGLAKGNLFTLTAGGNSIAVRLRGKPTDFTRLLIRDFLLAGG
ncbi:MAG: hypothetical protein OEM02_11880 [Desulfobulbaceae bacterium]|nr:hypothetical protein [Desulfobulbaceae bacterium]